MLPLRVRVDLGAMAMKGYSVFPQSPSITGTLHSDCLVSYPGHSLGGGFYPSAEVQSGVFYSPSRLGNCMKIDMPLNQVTKPKQNYTSPTFVGWARILLLLECRITPIYCYFCSILAPSTSISEGPIYVSNNPAWKVLVLNRNIWNHTTVCKLFMLRIII